MEGTDSERCTIISYGQTKQTKDLSYTVQHVVNGEVKDTQLKNPRCSYCSRICW
ncbi:MAG: hypothetical protein ACLRZZ_06635 [Enterocloster sp.]